MTFQIPNILGNLGHSEQGMGSLTSGVENLQRVEMQRRLAEINQNKEWERDDRLRNEKLTLEMSSVPTANFVTKFEMDKFAKGKDDYTNFLTERRRLRGGKLTTDDWIEISQKRSELADQTLRGKAFRDSFDKYQSSVISIRSKLKDPEEIAKFDEQQAVFAKKIADPKYEPNPYDAIEALQVPEPSANIVFTQTAKDLIPFVDKAVKEGANGREVVDEAAFMKSIKSGTDPNGYLFQKGVEEKKWSTPDEMYNQLADKVRTSIGINPTGWKPNEPTEKEQVEGFEGRMRSSVNEGETVGAYVFTKGGNITGSYTPEGSTKPTNARIRPIGIRSDGKLEAEFTIDRETVTDPMDKDAAMELKDEVGGKISSPDKNGNYTVIYTRPIKETKIIPLSQDIAQKIRRADSGAAKYLDNLDPYPNRTATKVVAANKTTRFTVDGKVYDIPTDKVAKFKQTYPNAK